MSKLMKRNQLIITALAALVAVAGYVNFGGKENAEKLVGAENQTTTVNQEETRGNEEADATVDSSMIEGNTTISEEEASKILAELNGETEDVDSTDVDISGEPGESILVNASGTYDYIVESKLEKECLRAELMESLLGIINNTELKAEEKKAAVDKYAMITTNAEKELLAETMIRARGYENAVVTMIDEKVDVIILAAPLDITEVTRIQDIVKSKTGAKAENITITVVDTSK